ncbi:MAG: ABC transporter permease [Lachnospiraceae bacterium]|nr:ABC transporter permease [Lachnospiraceae bacterium]
MVEQSQAQALYIKDLKRHKRKVRFFRILILVIFLAQWEITAAFHIVDPFIFSSPSRLIHCCYDMLLHNSLLYHIGITLFETLVSFFLVTLFTILIATILWLSKGISETLDPYLVVLNSLPKSALAPLLIVWLGGNYKTIIVTGMSVAIFGSILSLYTTFLTMDADKLLLIRTLGGTKKDVLFKILIPGNIPVILSIMKVNIGLCLVGVIIGEFIAAKKGLGYLIIYGSQVFKLDWVILSILILCIIAMTLYQLTSSIENKYVKMRNH